MDYIPPYSQLRNNLKISSTNGELLASAKLEDVEKFIRSILYAIPVDEEWYRKNYPDIDKAIKRGLVKSGQEHFVRDGYFEGRRPFAMAVDEEWYLAHYEDIASAVSAGVFPSARDHFASHGYDEGRMPRPLF